MHTIVSKNKNFLFNQGWLSWGRFCRTQHERGGDAVINQRVLITI